MTATVSVRRELPRSRAGPGQSTLLSRVFLERVGTRFVSYIELLFIVLTVYCVNLYIIRLQLISVFESV